MTRRGQEVLPLYCQTMACWWYRKVEVMLQIRGEQQLLLSAHSSIHKLRWLYYLCKADAHTRTHTLSMQEWNISSKGYPGHLCSRRALRCGISPDQLCPRSAEEAAQLHSIRHRKTSQLIPTSPWMKQQHGILIICKCSAIMKHKESKDYSYGIFLKDIEGLKGFWTVFHTTTTYLFVYYWDIRCYTSTD